MAELETLLSREEVEQIVGKKVDSDQVIVVKSFNFEPVGEWVGLCGDHAILHVQNEDESEEQFFVKLYPTVEYVVQFIEGTGSFRKEIFVYELIDKIIEEGGRLLSECVSKCYLSKANKCIILENLTEQGYVSPNKHDLLDYDTVKVVLESLAKLHASSLIYEEKISKKLNTTYRLIEQYETQFEETYFNDKDDFPNKPGLAAAITGVLNLIDLFNFPEKLISGKNFRQVLEKELSKIYQLVKPSKDFRNVLCHGDIWATNLLLQQNQEGKPVKCKLVDFQCARYAPPVQDVLSVIFLTTSRDFRQKHMYNLIGIYYSNLEKHLLGAGYKMKEIIPFDDFLMSCANMKIFAMIQAAMYFPLILLKSEVVQEYFSDSEKNKKALEEDRSLLVKEQMENDEMYKKRIIESLLDLKEYCDYL